MKKVVIIFLALALVFPVVSATILIDEQPQGLYNLGDIIIIPITVTSSQNIQGLLQMDLLCNGNQINFYKNSLSLSSGNEKKIEASLLLTKDVINNSIGTCKIKVFLGSDIALTSEFDISDMINIQIKSNKIEFNPGEKILVGGQAARKNGGAANGFIELSIMDGNISLVNKTRTINNGDFSLNTTLPKDMKAGAYVMKINAYETDINNRITNRGFTDQNIRINQVPTSLEIVFEQPNAGIEPGKAIRVKAILHDQTGEKIQSTGFITIKNKNDKILEQKEVATDEFIEYTTRSSEALGTWKVVALSNKLSTESKFQILEKESIAIDIKNKTITITNTGNVPYNRTALVKIGNESLNIDVYLGVGKSREYVITAPDGEYNVRVTVGSESVVAEGIALTGKTVDVKKSGGIRNLHPFIWIFAILILGFVAFIVFKKGYQRTFIGRIGKERKENNDDKSSTRSIFSLTKSSFVKSKNKAELSLSIKGQKQSASIVAIHIKNLDKISKKESSTEETVQKMVDIAEENKASTYENHETIFFIFAPVRTKTFKNESTALHTAIKIREILLRHNKMFKQKIDFGISVNYGEIIAKPEPEKGILKFMSMGTLVSSAKKLSALAHEEILLGERINDRLRSEVRTEKNNRQGATFFSIKEIRNRENHGKFLRGFLDRLDKNKKN